MKSLLCFIMMIFFCIFPCNYIKASDEIVVKITTEKSRFSKGDKIVLNVIVQNIFDREIRNIVISEKNGAMINNNGKVVIDSLETNESTTIKMEVKASENVNNNIVI